MSWKEPKVEPSPGFFPVSEAEINRKPDLKDLYLAVSSLNMGHGSPVIGVPLHGHHQPSVTSQSPNSSTSAILVKSEKDRQVISSSVHQTASKMPYLDCDTSGLMPPPFDLPIHKQMYESSYHKPRDSQTLTSTFRVSQNLMPPPRETSRMPQPAPPLKEPSHRDISHMPPPRESHLMPPPKVIPTPSSSANTSNLGPCVQVPKVEPLSMTSMPPPPSQGLSSMPPPPHSPNSLRLSSTSFQQEKETIGRCYRNCKDFKSQTNVCRREHKTE